MARTSRARIVFTTHGARGDLLPYLAIGQVLLARGHDPIIATSAGYRELVTAHGLAFHPIRPELPTGSDLTCMMQPSNGTEWLLRRHLLPAIGQTLDDLLPALEGANALVTHTTSLAGPLSAEMCRKRGFSWISGVVSPMALFSRTDPPALPVAPWAERAPAFNRLLLGLLERQFGEFLKPVRRERLKRGLTPGGNPLFHDAHSSTLGLGLFSSSLAPRQPDWPAHFRAIGFCFPRSSGDLPGHLQEFLSNGPPPLLFAAASFAAGESTLWVDDCLEAARRLGQRALILGADPPAAPDRPDSGALFLPYAPLELVLPHVAAFVHQGGIGALAQGLRAGTPMVLCPLSHDQPDTARMALRAGVAEVIPRRGYSGETAAAAIGRSLSDETQRENRERISEKIGAENGAMAAADLIEALL